MLHQTFGTNAKKKTFYDPSKDDDSAQERRKEFVKEVKDLALDRLVFIDETGVHLAMARTHGRALKGERVYEAKRNRPKISEKYTWISALSQNELFAHFELNGSMTSEAFLVYVQQILLPALRPDQIVIMDNLACHKTDAVIEAFNEAEQAYIFLPPYSP